MLKWRYCLGFIVLIIHCAAAWAVDVPISLFPLANYSQDVDHWLPPQDSQYRTPLLTPQMQQARLQDFYNHTFASGVEALSPWSETFVNKVLQQAPGLLAGQRSLVKGFSNEDKDAKNMGYGENFRPYPQSWIDSIAANMQLKQFEGELRYKPQRRGILVQNTAARLLPTRDPHFYRFDIAGQGYPFDNLQASALWVGTPVYILGQTQDRAWSLVMTPTLVSWVESTAVAKVDDHFVQRWQGVAHHKMAAITQTNTPVTDNFYHQYRFSGYVGTVLPLLSEQSQSLRVLIPAKDSQGNARIYYGDIDKKAAAAMPLLATRENFARLFKTLQNRPYGWGGLYFYNDCSQELQSLFAPFAIWLPRHSSDQPKAGSVVDKGSDNLQARINYLAAQGKPLLTIVYIGGHVFLYVGNYPNPHAPGHQSMIMTYQNVWGLKPADGSRRAVIGQLLFLPLLASYPEDNSLQSLADKKYFQVSYLDQLPADAASWLVPLPGG